MYGIFFISSEQIRDRRITIQIYYGEENYVCGVFSINSEEKKIEEKKTVEIYYHTPNNNNVRIWKASTPAVTALFVSCCWGGVGSCFCSIDVAVIVL